MHTVTFDVETHSADLLWSMPPEEFVRLAGYSFGNESTVHLTTDLDELRSVLRSADFIVGHNIHAFDLTAVFGAGSIEPLTLARQGRLFDTWTHSTLVHPAPTQFTGCDGRGRLVNGPEQAKSWHKLDEQAHQLGVQGKSLNLKDLAKEFGGFGEIPVTDERFRDYLRHDVLATREVAKALLRLGPLDSYAKREQLVAAIAAQITRNGWRVDVAEAERRIAENDAVLQGYMKMLVETYGMPTEGKAPLRTNAGKAAVLAALKSVGVRESDLKRTANGAPSLGGDSVKAAAQGKGEEAEALADALAGIGGLRPLAAAALKHLQPDGKVHPQIATLQRSGRWSTQDPGLTIWGNQGEGLADKRYFVPNGADEVLVEFDYSNADARMVAALSGDRKYAERFEPGADGHTMNAEAVWGKDVVATDPAGYRQRAKAPGHGWSYRVGPNKLAALTGMPLAEARKFLKGMDEAFPRVVEWQNWAAQQGRSGWITNDWGRRMPVEVNRAYNQAPALLGQSGTREIVCDGLIALPDAALQMVVAQIHDALVFSIPEEHKDSIVAGITRCLETTWKPRRNGQEIHFPVGHGEFAKTWEDAAHG